MDSPQVPLTPNPGVHPPGSPVSSRRSAQVALAAFLAVLLGLLAFRGYGNRLGARPTEPVTGPRIDLNHADRVELEQIPGIGPKLAQAIDAHRKEKGPFRSVDQLREVKGVGPATFDKLRPYFHVEPGPAPPAESSPSEPLELSRKPATATAPRAATGSKKLQPGDPPVNVNTASAEELQKLDGIGPKFAQAIIEARTAEPFKAVEDLKRVKGIGAKTIEKLRPVVVVK